MWEQLDEWAADQKCPVCGHVGLRIARRLIPMAGRSGSMRKSPELYCPNKACDFTGSEQAIE